MTPPFDYSVVMEWDNPRTSDAGRALDAVKLVAEQMRGLSGSGELLVLFPSDVFDGEVLRSDLEKLTHGIDLRLIPKPGGTYYQLKNEGVRAAGGRIVAFVDSDLLLEPGCLGAILGSLEDPSVDVVVSRTHVERRNVYEQTFALSWGFPLRAERPTGLRPALRFFANCVAARRELWLRFPFTNETVRFRGMCMDVARRMRASGASIWIQTAAQAAHPPPRGPEFAPRALAQGRDRALTLRRTRGTTRSFFRLWAWFWKKAVRGNLRILRHHAKVGMKAPALPVAWAINGCYYSLGWLSGVVTLMRPALVRESLREQRAGSPT